MESPFAPELETQPQALTKLLNENSPFAAPETAPVYENYPGRYASGEAFDTEGAWEMEDLYTEPEAWAGEIPSGRLENLRYSGGNAWANRADYLELRRKAYEAHVARALRAGRSFTPTLSSDQLKRVDGSSHTMRTAAADALGPLLAAARAELGAGVRIQVASGYRTADDQFNAWVRNFPKYLRRFLDQHGNPNDPTALSALIGRWLAAPGFSLHNSGVAVDLSSTENGQSFQVSSSNGHPDFWRQNSRLWRWLKQNAGRFGFREYSPEPWHWEYSGALAPVQPAASDPVPSPASSPSGPAGSGRAGQDAVGQNERWSAQLGRQAYYERINDVLLPFSGLSGVSLGPEAFAQALAGWQAAQGLQADGVLGPRTWARLQPLLAGQGSSGTGPATPAPRASVPAAAAPAAPASGTVRIEQAVVGRIQGYSALIDRISTELGADGNFVRGIIAAESGGRSDAGKGRTGYKGLMQAGREENQLDPETSLRTGIKKLLEFRDRYVPPFVRRLGLTGAIQGDDYLRLVLSAYNAGQGTVGRALTYAHQAGNWRNWQEPRFYKTALLFSGGYDTNKACSQNATAADLEAAKRQKKNLVANSRQWYNGQSPWPWEQLAAILSPIVACWVERKQLATGGYIDKIMAYYRYFQNVPSHEMEAESYSVNETEDFFQEAILGEEELPGEYYDSSESEWEADEAMLYPESENESFEPEEENFSDLNCAAPATTGLAGTTAFLPVSGLQDARMQTGAYIPSGFRANGPVDLVLHLHGLYKKGQAADGVQWYWENYAKLRECFEESRRNAILLLPLLGMDPQKSRHIFLTKGGFDTFITQCLAQLSAQGFLPANAQPGRIIVAGHSAGGAPMSRIVNSRTNHLTGNILECWGFDCLYGYDFSAWLAKSPQNRLYHYWAYSSSKAISRPGRNGGILSKRFPANMFNIAPHRTVHHQGVIEYAWREEINPRTWFQPIGAVASPASPEYYSDELYGPETEEFDSFEPEMEEHFGADEPEQYEFEDEQPDMEDFLESREDELAAVGQNERWSAQLGWQAYYERINDVLLPFSGLSGVSLGPEAFAQALAGWQAAQGLQADGVLGPRTWARLQPLLAGQGSSGTGPATPAPGSGSVLAENQRHAAGILDAAAAGFVRFNIHTGSDPRAQLESLRAGQSVLHVDPAAGPVRILPLLHHICTMARQANYPDLVIGSFIRPPADGKCKGHCKGNCIDLNYKGGPFTQPGALQMVLSIFSWIAQFPGATHLGLGFGMPMQGRFFPPGTLPIQRGNRTTDLIEPQLRQWVTQLNAISFSDNPNHLHIQIVG